MKNYTIIEDLDSQFYQSVGLKHYAQLLSECFIRNFFIIKKYSYTQQDLLLSNFKKKVIPRYVQEIAEYESQIQERHRRVYYNKRRVSQQDFLTQTKDKNSGIIDFHQNQANNQNYRNFSKKNEKKMEKMLSQPSLGNWDQKDQIPQKQRKQHNQLLKSQFIHLKILQLVKNEQKTSKQSFKKTSAQISKTSKIPSSESKLQASIYNDSINYDKKLIFQTTLTKISRTRQQRNFEQLITQKQSKINRISSNQNSEQNILQKKMISILKQKKASNKLKFKQASSYFLNKNLFNGNENKENVNNTIKDSINHSHNSSCSIIKENHIKTNSINLALKGKYIITNKHKVSNSCTLQTVFPSQKDTSNIYPRHPRKIIQKISNDIIYEELPQLKSIQRVPRSKRNRSIPNFKENIIIQRYKNQKMLEKSFSLPKF